ncbi:MAG: hypothetical protein JWQ03_3180 [Variovorax sp.]|nr:hypothetical protein [Variovorax sp.]
MVSRLLQVRTGRHPHELLILIASTVLGLVGTVLPGEISSAIATVMDGWTVHAFWAGLAVFAGASLYGILKRGVEGLLIERVGLFGLAMFYLAYSVAVIDYAGWGGLVSVALPLCFAIGNLGRIWQIRTDLRLVKSYLKDHPDERV